MSTMNKLEILGKQKLEVGLALLKKYIAFTAKRQTKKNFRYKSI